MSAIDYHVDELIPGYLAGVLDADERRAVEEHAATCPSCATLLHELRPAAEALVDGSIDHPTRLAAVFAGIDQPSEPLPTLAARRRTRWLRPAGLLVAAAAIAVIAFGVGRSTAPGGTPRDGAPLAQLSALAGERGAGKAVLASEHGVRYVRLRLSDLPAVTADGYYEAWLGRNDGGMIALGTFRPHTDGSADLLLPLPVDAGRFDFVDVSAEPGDGNPAHSDRSVVRGLIRHA
jgi:anti-sigma-K factor RskA